MSHNISKQISDVIPRYSSRQYLLEMHVFDRINSDIADFQTQFGEQCQFVIAGDMNARTGEYLDYVNHEEQHYVPLPNDYHADDDLPNRTSCDKKTSDEYGHKLLDLCKSCSLRIVNGRVGSDKGIGNFTTTSYRGRSVIDYALCTIEMFKYISEFKVQDLNEWSDHCLLSLSIDTDCMTSTTTNSSFIHKLKWNSDKKEEYIKSLVNIMPDIETITQSLSTNLNKKQVDDTMI